MRKLFFVSSKVHFFVIIIFFVSITLTICAECDAAGNVAQLQLYMAIELKYLPNYCQYRLAEIKFDDNFTDINGKINFPTSFKKPLNKWINAIGKQNWIYFHHYCDGIRDYTDYTSKVYSISENKRAAFKKNQMERALSQFEFMRHAKTLNFPFWYDLYRYEAYIYLQLGNTAKAKWALKKSLKYKKSNLKFK